MKAADHPKNPKNQPFNVGARKNLTKRNAWWQKHPFHNNGNRTKK